MPRHPGVTGLLRWLEPNNNLPPHLRRVAAITRLAAEDVMDEITVDSPELTEGLRKLLEAKDCFVRAAIIADDKES
jgi:hypothetical protein